MTTRIGSGAWANALVIQPDGKLVAAGYGSNGHRFALARYTANGARDPSFGFNGVVRTLIGQGGGQIIWALVIQPDGKLVAAGSTGDPATLIQVFALARYLG